MGTVSGGGGESYRSDLGGAGGKNGEDGGNGTQCSGGHGSKLDLSTLHMKNFVLTPGKGGEPVGGFYFIQFKLHKKHIICDCCVFGQIMWIVEFPAPNLYLTENVFRIFWGWWWRGCYQWNKTRQHYILWRRLWWWSLRIGLH